MFTGIIKNTANNYRIIRPDGDEYVVHDMEYKEKRYDRDVVRDSYHNKKIEIIYDNSKLNTIKGLIIENVAGERYKLSLDNMGYIRFRNVSTSELMPSKMTWYDAWQNLSNENKDGGRPTWVVVGKES